MVRYLMYMSYIGTRYRGSAGRFNPAQLLDVDSVQGVIEGGLLALSPQTLTQPKLTLSSRTDAGVHALCATAHVELSNQDEKIYNSDDMLRWLNRYLIKCGHEIRITSFFPILDSFHARHDAQSRTYVYRILYPKFEDEIKLPISELGRSWNLSETKFDVEKARAATRLFMGSKNFQTFSGTNRTNRKWRYVRKLNELRIEDGQPLMSLDPLSHNFYYWNIICSGRSFLYNQVRRIVASLIGVGTGVLTEKDVNIMLHVPSNYSWPSYLQIAPPHGLYLKHVAYDPENLRLSRIREQVN